jgi:hypothetical protein
VTELLGIARFKFKEGKREEYLRLSAQAMEIVRTKDSGTLQAAIEHAANLADVSAAVLATVSVVHGELVGEPSAKLRARLADSEVPQLFTPYESM